jgi:formate-dependent nitrite reductase membrane component NrfD
VEVLGFSIIDWGLLVTLFSIGMLVFEPIAGIFSDRIGRRFFKRFSHFFLLFFSFFSMAHFYLWLPGRFDYLKIIPAIQSNKFLSRFQGDNLTKIRGLVAGFGIPISIGVGIYTGVLLGALTARPFWNNPMLPMLFLISAMMTGSAAICFVGCFVKGFWGMTREQIRQEESKKLKLEASADEVKISRLTPARIANLRKS